MTTGSTTTRLTNHPSAGDPAVQTHLCVSDGVESALSIVSAEPAPSELTPCLIVVPNIDPNAAPTADSKTDSWRVEVAARLARYRTRRKPRAPRYPSLLLPFDAFEGWSRPAPPPESETGRSLTVVPVPDGQTSGLATHEASAAVSSERGSHGYREAISEQSAKVIEFPRFAAIPVFHASELADPIFDRPRIVEAPEILPPPPALGGMLIETAHREPAGRRPAADCPTASASLARRALAALVDGLLMGTALAGSAAIFLRFNPMRGPLPQLAVALGAVAVFLWLTYEFLFVVYTGSTPGLRAARLRLAKFDGSPLNRRARRWRVLASVLSAFCAGLGYLWCLLDEDGLCWHDRITRTHIQSKAEAALEAE